MYGFGAKVINFRSADLANMRDVATFVKTNVIFTFYA